MTGTYLDSSRFRVAIAQKLDINAQSVHAWIIGEHGDSSVPVWSGVNIAGINIKDAIADFDAHEKSWAQIHEDVKASAYKVIQCKGSVFGSPIFANLSSGYTNWAIGSAVSRIIESILRDERRVLPLSTLVQGMHGIKEDVFLSLPCTYPILPSPTRTNFFAGVIRQSGITQVLEQPLSDDEVARLQKSAKEMYELQSTLKL